MLTIRNNTITLTRGDTARIDLTLSKDGESYDYSADTVVFSVKKTTSTPTYIMQKTVTDGVIYIAPDDTENLSYGDYVYDVQLTTQSGDVCTVIPPSKFTLATEVTCAATE